MNGNKASTFSDSRKKTNTKGNFGNQLSQKNKMDGFELNEFNALKNMPGNSTRYQSELKSMSRNYKENKHYSNESGFGSANNYKTIENNNNDNDNDDDDSDELSNYNNYHNNHNASRSSVVNNRNDRGKREDRRSLTSSRNSKDDRESHREKEKRLRQTFNNVNHDFNGENVRFFCYNCKNCSYCKNSFIFECSSPKLRQLNHFKKVHFEQL